MPFSYFDGPQKFSASVREFALMLIETPLSLRNRRGSESLQPASMHVVQSCVDYAQRAGALAKDVHVQRVVFTVSELAVGILIDASEHPVAVLKVARSSDGARRLRYEHDILESLRQYAALQTFVELTPQLLYLADTPAHFFVIESFKPGLPLREVADHEAWIPLQYRAEEVLGDLHGATGTTQQTDEETLHALIDEPLSVLSKWAVVHKPHHQRRMGDLYDRLYRNLSGRRIFVSALQGDAGQGNILAENGVITGLVDWEDARLSGVSFLDIAQLVLDVHARVRKIDLGQAVLSLQHADNIDDVSAALLNTFWARGRGDELDAGTLAILGWLRHVMTEPRKSPQRSVSRFWRYRTIDKVFYGLAR